MWTDINFMRFSRRFVSLALIGVGALLVGAAGTYLAYGWWADQGLDSLAYKPADWSPTTASGSATTLDELLGDSVSSSPEVTGNGASPDPANVRLYPGEQLSFVSWNDPWSAVPPSTADIELAEGFLPVAQFSIAALGEMPTASRIAIPAIGVDATVQELEILDLGDSRQYETPNRVVGHIPTTANPGEAGSNWLFGHLQSPLRGEGAVFRNLPKVPDLLRNGETVYIVLDGDDGSYLYEAYTTEVVHKDDLQLSTTDDATVTLVACVPFMKYDNRLLVKAQLVGFKPAA